MHTYSLAELLRAAYMLNMNVCHLAASQGLVIEPEHAHQFLRNLHAMQRLADLGKYAATICVSVC